MPHVQTHIYIILLISVLLILKSLFLPVSFHLCDIADVNSSWNVPCSSSWTCMWYWILFSSSRTCKCYRFSTCTAWCGSNCGQCWICIIHQSLQWFSFTAKIKRMKTSFAWYFDSESRICTPESCVPYQVIINIQCLMFVSKTILFNTHQGLASSFCFGGLFIAC